MIPLNDVHAQRLRDDNVVARRDDFFDWPRIKEIWITLTTWDALKAEYDRVAGVYEPWREIWLSNQREALAILENHPNRDDIELGYDIQLAYEHWQRRGYWRWRHAFEGQRGWYPTFEDVVTERRGRVCPPHHDKFGIFGDRCGNLPDWRSDKRKASDRALYDRYAERHAEWLAGRAERERAAEAGNDPL